MRETFRRSMLWLHSWAGLTLGWISFLIFFTGSLAYFQSEITNWMRPELRHPVSTASAIDVALDRLRVVAPRAAVWTVELPTERDPRLTIDWRAAPGAPQSGETLNAANGAPIEPTKTLGGRFFYSFHFTLMLPGWGYWLAGIAAMFMLVALISGVVVHRKIFKDFFTFRTRQSAHRGWLDVHNLSSVLALPFHVVIVYTGLITLMYSYMPHIVTGVYGDKPNTFFREAFQRGEDALAPDRNEQLPLTGLAARVAEIAALGGVITDLRIVAPAMPDASVTITRGFDSQVLLPYAGGASVPASLYDLSYELHLARFADWTVRWLLFASGLAGSAMIGTGLIVWTLKKRNRATTPLERVGVALVERLNVGVLAGSVLSTAAFFWANRLLPLELERRGFLEIQCFFAVWIIAGLHALLRPAPRAWSEQLWCIGIAFGCLPLVSGLGTGRHLASSLASADWAFVAFDTLALATAAFAIYAARRLTKRGSAESTSAAATATQLSEPLSAAGKATA